ncbi:phage major capsid protein [Actinomadura sp. 21ATH]|uniref:phage major capsid protein n=1 Tax=Actinomadura sp. 21ATH TaxID=1735444 RepID=UPI0035C17050
MTSTRIRLSRGQREHLLRMGIDPARAGRIYNRRAPVLPKDITVPDSPEGLAEFMGDPGKYKPVLASKDTLEAFIREYANKLQGDGTKLQQLVAEQTQREMANFLREGGIERLDLRDKAPGLDPYSAVAAKSLQKQGLYNKGAVGAKFDDMFDTSGEMFRAIWRGNPNKDSADVSAKLEKLRNFGSDIPSDGGFLIPERLRSELLKVALESAIVRPRARVIPMETLRVPFPAIDTSSNVDSVYGGIVGYWTEEGATLTESAAKFSRIVLEARKLTAFTRVPSELLADSIISLTAFIDQMFPEALAFFEDMAFLSGNGVGQPLGMLNGNAAINVTRTASGNDVEFDDVVNMYSRMLPQSISRAVWMASIDTFPSLAKMALTRGTDGIASPAMWMTGGQAIGAPPLTLLGRPVIFTEKVPSSGASGDISFVDWGFYLIGDRQAMQARQSEERYFETDEVAFRVIERVDGRPWLQSAITPANAGDTLSPIVKLTAAA